jgi:hypothetical protein
MSYIPHSPREGKDLLGTLNEFAYAEYGSFLEILALAKKAKSSRRKFGFIKHALDEYRHSSLFFKILSNQAKRGVGKFKREYRYFPQNVIIKGYVDKEGFLIEKLSLKKLLEFVYANELMVKETFDRLKKINSIIQDEESINILNSIMKDELDHHGQAKKLYEIKFPDSKLQFALKKERIKRNFRLINFHNIKFLNKIFDLIINFFISCFGKIINLITVPDSKNENLMTLDPQSVI